MTSKKSKKFKEKIIDGGSVYNKSDFDDSIAESEPKNGSINLPKSLDSESNRKKFEDRRNKLSNQDQRRRVDGLFDSHRSMCSEVGSLVESINGVIKKMAALDRRMSDPDDSKLLISKKLNMAPMMNELRVASSRLEKTKKMSIICNGARRESILEEIDIDKPMFKQHIEH